MTAMLGIPLTRIVLVFTTLTLTDTSMVTSIDRLRDLASGKNDAIGDAIHNAIKLEMSKVQSLTQALVDHSKSSTLDIGNLNLNHPNDIYLLIRHYVSVYTGEDNKNPALWEHLKQDAGSSLPTTADLRDARTALVRLQRVYGLDVRDMLRGDYRGHVGKPLDSQDVFLIGSEAFQQGFPKEAIMWLELAVEELSSQSKPRLKDPTYGNVAHRHLKALALLGRVYFYENQTGIARKVLSQCKSFKNVTVSRISEVTAFERELNAVDARAAMAKYVRNYKDTDANASALCSRPKHQRVEALRPFHACRLKPDVHVTYLLYTEEILSLKPYVSLFYDVIYDKEIQHLTAVVKKNLHPGTVVQTKDKTGVSKDRTGQVAWSEDTDTMTRRLSQRTKAITRLEVQKSAGRTPSAEAFQVVNYGLGGHYDVHMDAMMPENVMPSWKQSGNRIATFLLYLSDVEVGGSTIFPYAGISVSPKKGMALLWYSFQPAADQRDYMTRHAGCPVVIGNKWIANKWIWTYGNTFRRPCGLTPDTQQLEVEKLFAENIPFMELEPRSSSTPSPCHECRS